jgi:hypothetical protein
MGQGEKLDEESDRDKRIRALEAELASLEASIVEKVRTVRGVSHSRTLSLARALGCGRG